MLTHYTPEQIKQFAAFYEKHGAVRLPGLIPRQDAAALLARVDEVAATADAPRKAGSALSFGRAEGRMTIRYMWRETPQVRDFMLRPELAEPIASIVGARSLRFWFDLAFIHQGSGTGDDGAGTGTGWHHDIAAFAFKGDQLPSLWMALTPTNAERSRLMFIDGSHRDVPGYYRPPGIAPRTDGTADGYVTPPDFDRLVADGSEKILTWDCEPGDAIIIHPYAVHGARGNADSSGANRRVAITTRWLGDDVRFLPIEMGSAFRMPGLAESGLSLGARPKGEWFPEVWNRDAVTSVG